MNKDVRTQSLLLVFVMAILLVPSVVRSDDYTTTFSKGWHLITLPCQPSSTDPTVVFASPFEEVYAIDEDGFYSYALEMTSVNPGLGYWIYFENETTVTIQGTQLSGESQSVTLKPGWNMVGSPFSSSTWTDATIDGTPVSESSLLETGIYYYNESTGDYELATVLLPWKGYFVKASSAVTTASLAIDNGGTVVNPGQIQGTATLAGQSDHSGITARVTGTSFQDTTDSAGSYTITDVPAGTWDVELSKSGYVSATVEDIVVVSEGTASAGSVQLAAESSAGPTISNFSPANGATVSSSQPTISAVFTDTGNGVNTSSAVILVRSADVTSQATVQTSGFTYTPSSALSDGAVAVSVTIEDNLGNSTTATSSFTIATDLDPDQPSNIQASTCTHGEHTLLCITWDNAENTDINGYNVYVYHNSETFESPYNGSRAVPVNRFTVGGLTPGESYGIEITGVQVDGTGLILAESAHTDRATKNTVATAGNQAVVSMRAIAEEDPNYAGRIGRWAAKTTSGDLLKGLIAVSDAAASLKTQEGATAATATTGEFGWVEFVTDSEGEYDITVLDDGGTPEDPNDDIFIDKQDITLAAGAKFIVPNAYLSIDGTGEYCGDGIINRCEGCDDGNRDDGDGCTWVCEREDPSKHGGAICQSETWYAADSPHIVDDYVLVRGFYDPVLTIEAGSEVRFEPGTGLFVGADVQTDGALIADGSGGAITFTSNATSPAAGDWIGISLLRGALPTSILDNVTIQYAGGATASLYVNAPVDSIHNSTISDGLGTGVYFDYFGYAINGFATSTVTGHASRSVVIYPNYVPYILGGNDFSGNTDDVIEVHAGNGATAGIWRNHGVPYRVTGDVSLWDDTTFENFNTVYVQGRFANGDFANRPVLTIGAGNTWYFSPGAYMEIGHEDGVNWDYGSIVADGTNGAITFTSVQDTPAAGDWIGMVLGPRTQPETLLDNVTISYAGGTGATASLAIYDVIDSIKNTTISNGATTGVYFADASYPTNGFSDSTVTGNSGVSIILYPITVPFLLDGNTFTGNGYGYITVNGGTATKAGMWRNFGLNYNVTGDVIIKTESPYDETVFEGGAEYDFNGTLYVETDVRFAAETTALFDGDIIVADFAQRPFLTIGSNSSFLFNDGYKIDIGVDEGLTDYGGMIADGSTGSIYFSSTSDTVAPGAWKGITFGTRVMQTTKLDNVVIEGAGGYGATASVMVMARIDSITNSTIQTGATAAVVFADGGYTYSGFSTNTVTTHAGVPLQLYGNYISYLGSGNDLTGNTTDKVAVLSDTVDIAGTWRNMGAQYEFRGGMNFIEDATFESDITVVALGDVTVGNFGNLPWLTIGPGGTWKFAAGKRLYVGNEGTNWDYGSLVADGTSGTITFTSNEASPAAGDWKGIHLAPRTRPGTIINNCVVEYGGGNGYGNIYLEGTGTDATITNNSIVNSSSYGVYVDSASTFDSGDETTNTFSGNSSGDVFRE